MKKTKMLRHAALFAALAPLAIPHFSAALFGSPKSKIQNLKSDTVWLEGESPTQNNLKSGVMNIAGWGHKEFLSGEQWLQISIDADKLDSTLPTGGALLSYDFTLSQDGKHEIWNRIGYEFVRSPFEWRVDNGAWQTIKPDELTTDLMELQNWNEVAWLKLGEQNLTAGPHTLQIRLPRTTDDKGKPQRILYASDALCITSGPFSPNGKYKPGEYRNIPEDKAAAEKTFSVPDLAAVADENSKPPIPLSARRVTVPLEGTWQICRDDENMPGPVAQPISSLPQNPIWTGIAVPSDKNVSRPDLMMAHRLWYRTKINVPAGLANRSFVLHFGQNCLNTTVWVNGVLCGFNKNPFAPFDIDVTKGMKPGTNELWVGIRDAWYGYQQDPKNPMRLRRKFNLPLDFANQGFQDLDYPIWHGFQSGILDTPTLTVAGPVYTSDVQIIPYTAKTRELITQTTVANPSGQAVSGEVRNEAVNPRTGQIEKQLGVNAFTVPAGESRPVGNIAPWKEGKLWWPGPNPNLYILRTTLFVNGKTVDVQEITFGFRQWSYNGSDFTLNGQVWRVWADLNAGDTPETWLANYRKLHQRTMRLMGVSQGGTRWLGMTPEQALDWCDRNGVNVRRCGPIDGEAIGYALTDDDPERRTKYGTDARIELMNNWRDQMLQQVKAERNHPSIQLWSIENEFLYINIINLMGGTPTMDRYEQEVKKCSDAVQAIDPSRLVMTDGGGANKDNVMPVHGNHYVFGDQGYGKYPALAYDRNPNGGGRGRWTWDEKRPRFIGEDYYATGINPSDYAYFGGEEAFQGKAQARPAAGLIFRMLTEGYRWAGQSAWQFWLGPGDVAGNPYNAQSPRAVFCRQWDWTFGSGQKVKRTLGIFNDTHDPDPITLTWTLTVGGKKVASQTTVHNIAPGTSEKFDITLPIPVVASRQEGTFALTLTEEGKVAYQDSKPVSILNTTLQSNRSSGLTTLSAKTLAVFDPHGSVTTYLKSRAVPFTLLTSLKTLPASAKVLLIGRDALDVQESASSHLAAYASAGHSVVVLEQLNPLRYQGLPADMEAATNEGQTAFGEDLTHPTLRGLQQKDFFTWAGKNEIVYRNAYQKPNRGAKSLIQCDNRLQNTALVEIPSGKGLLLLSQLVIGEKLASSAPAQQLLNNLLAYAGEYKLTYRPVTVVANGDASLAKTVDAISLSYDKASDPLSAISTSGSRITVVEATPENLHVLAANLPKVQSFTAGGGWLVLHGLAPDGLADYNKIVGFEHMIRPFRRERVAFPARKSPLLAGVTTGDIVMTSGERIFNYTADEYVASDIFSYCVDYDDVAPFAHYANDFHEHMANGFVGSDGWPLIINLPIKDAVFPLTFSKPQQISEFVWSANNNYNPTTKVELAFDGGANGTVTLATNPNTDPQAFPLNPPRKAEKELTLKITELKKVRDDDLIGVDNIHLKPARPADFYTRVVPLVNVGAMMEYPHGKGGIVLCNLLFKDAEAVPENAVKKRTIFAALLRNLKAPFAGGGNVIAGANLKYTSVDIGKSANQYRDERGWFGDKNFTFKDLPTGRQTFAGVPFQIYDFPTSPVPTAIMLGGNGIPNNSTQEVRGIPINAKADALFFFQSARIDAPLNDDDHRNKRRFEIARYVVHYADGQTVDVPLIQDVDLADYRQKTPMPIPGAQLAWMRPYGGTEWSAVAYSKQWNNPRPTVPIASVDLVYGKDKGRGVPVLLAITAATAQ